jgi:hypothetical protein
MCFDGECIEDPCFSMRCPTGRVCVEGVCVHDECRDLQCPEETVCRDGRCEPESPLPPEEVGPPPEDAGMDSGRPDEPDVAADAGADAADVAKPVGAASITTVRIMINILWSICAPPLSAGLRSTRRPFPLYNTEIVPLQ